MRVGGAAKMRRGLLLVTLFVILKLRCSQSRCEETGSRRSTSDVGFSARNARSDFQHVFQQKRINFLLLVLLIASDYRLGQSQAEHSEEIQ